MSTILADYEQRNGQALFFLMVPYGEAVLSETGENDHPFFHGTLRAGYALRDLREQV